MVKFKNPSAARVSSRRGILGQREDTAVMNVAADKLEEHPGICS